LPLTDTPPSAVLDILSRSTPVSARTTPIIGSPGGNGHSPSANGAKSKKGVPAGTSDGEARISLAGDLGRDGRYGVRWLIVDHTHLRVISVIDGKAEIDLDLPLSDIAQPITDTLVGTGVLLLRRTDGVVIEALRYTVGLAPRFGIASRVLEGYLKGEEPDESLTDGADEKVCRKCGKAIPADSGVCPTCLDKRAVLTRLMRYTLPYKWQMVLVSVLMISGTALMLLPPLVGQHLLDDVLIPHRHRSWIGWMVAILLLTNVASIALGIWRGRVTAWISNHMVYRLRSQVYARLQQLSISYYDKRQTGQLVTRVTQDVNELQSFIVDGIQFFIVNALMIVGTIAILLYKDWQLTLLVLVPLPFTVLLTRNVFKILWGRLHRLYYLRSSLTGVITATLSGVRVVKAFAQELRETERFRERAEWLFDAGVVVEQSWATYFPIMNFISTIGTFIIWYGGSLAVFANKSNSPAGGHMTIGVLQMFLSYVAMVLAPIQGMTRIADWLSRATASADRVFELLDAEPEVANVDEPARMEHIEGRVELRNVRFSYDKSRDVLEDVSVVVEPGEMIGLVGHSGAGKSTLINLLSRFYDVREGTILIDGVDIRNIDINDVRRQIGVVLQEPFLFPGTISENIAYARIEAEPEAIIQAAKAANAHDFIMRFGDGYDTFVGERGVRLSGGERQRISIARAVLHDPRILILDEATASVDTETEKQIQEAITRLIAGRTTFAIAHRLSTLRNANRLMVIERGKLVELGTHDELLAKPDGVFKKLVDMQREVNQMRQV
jgi:ATP-binding cassette subfamily B protein